MTTMEMVGGASSIALVLGLVQLAKILGLKEKYCPFLSLCLGLLVSLGYHFYNHKTWYEAVIIGLVIGLSAMGLYSGTKETVQMLVCKEETEGD
ncbi:MAG: hypothetical protein GX989_02050 [Firmicutes bacterium]|nr:hypothetical protein [Bacillota bacterium]